MRRSSPADRYSQLAEIPTPSALVTLAWTHRAAAALPSLRAFKNVTDLDLTGNLLNTLPEIQQLRYLRKLSLSANNLERLWPFPPSLEHLCLSDNRLTSLTALQGLKHLHTLDVSNNQLTAVNTGGLLPALKCLYAAHNQIATLEDLKRMPALTEADLGENALATSSDISTLHWSSLCAVRLAGNPALLQTLTQDAGPWDFTLLEAGLFIRNSEKLKALRSSRFRKLIKDRHQSTFLSSPDWGHAKTSSREGEDFHKVSSDPISLESQRFSQPTRKSDVSRGSLRLPLSELSAEVQDQSCLFTTKLEETCHQNEEESLHFIFQDLIAYCHLAEEEDFSFSAEKYERVVGILKQREDERVALTRSYAQMQEKVKQLEEALLDQERLQMRLNDAESQLHLKSLTHLCFAKLRKDNVTLSQRLEPTGRIKDTLEDLQAENLQLKRTLEEERKRCEAHALDHLSHLQEITQLHCESDNLRLELNEQSQGFLVLPTQAKIRELEEEGGKVGKLNNSFEEPQSRLDLSNCSYYRKAGEGTVVISKRIGTYIEQLKARLEKKEQKIRALREQRDRSTARVTVLMQALQARV